MYKGKRVLCFRQGSPTPHVHARAFIYPPRVTGGIGRCRGIGGHRDRPAAYPLGMHDGSMFQVSVTEPITKAIKIDIIRKKTHWTRPRGFDADPRVSSQINGPPFSICACKLATGGSHIHSSNGVLYMVFKGAAYVSCLKQQCINDLHLKFEKHKNELDSRRSILSSLDGYKKWVQVLEGDFSNSEASKSVKSHQ